LSIVNTSAPGKIVVCGEYAVLCGAPAISMAVDRRARVKVTTAQDHGSSLHTMGVSNGDFGFGIDPHGEIAWQDAAGPALFSEVWRESSIGQIAPVQIAIDTRDFHDHATGTKLGFGSSAAVAVALSAALAAVQGESVDCAKMAATAHRRYQHENGSGVDVATSISGGVIGFRMTNADAPALLQWPPGLRYQVLWSGHAANTVEKIQNIPGADSSSPAMNALMRGAETVAVNWVEADSGALLQSIHNYVDSLIDLDTELNLGIFTAGHGELVELAQELNVIYKPCGAGGGDTGMVLTDSDDGRIDEYTRAATRRGFTALDVTLDTGGVILERSAV
jgi:phosphomevalonate kinase